MTTDIPLYLLTVAPADRIEEVNDLFASLPDIPSKRRVVVTTEPNPIQIGEVEAYVPRYPHTDINISKWWERGLSLIAGLACHSGHAEWDILIAESDARMTPEDVETVRTAMRKTSAVMAGADWYNILGGSGYSWLRTTNEKPPAHILQNMNLPGVQDSRIPGVMCVVRGETGIRHDSQFRWWLADDDFEWEHRVSGGTLLVGGTTVKHTGTQGELRGERLIAWQEDQVKFKNKWGALPADGGI